MLSLAVCLKHSINSVCILISISQFIPPFCSPLVSTCLFSMSLFHFENKIICTIFLVESLDLFFLSPFSSRTTVGGMSLTWVLRVFWAVRKDPLKSPAVQTRRRKTSPSSHRLLRGGGSRCLRSALRIRVFYEERGRGLELEKKKDEVAVGCTAWSYIQKGLGTEVSFTLSPEGGDVGAWMGSVAVRRRSPAFP